MTAAEKVKRANERVMEIFLKARPVWTDMRHAAEVIPGMKENTILVPGPPIEPERIPAPVRTSICGAAVHEKLAKTTGEAWDMVLAGEIEIEPAQDHNCGCAACMVTSASMPVIVCEDMTSGGVGFSVPHPGPKPKVLRWGMYDEEVEADLEFFRDEYCAFLAEGVRAAGGVDIIDVLSHTAGMGDENHNRQPAASMYLALKLTPYLLEVDHPLKNRLICDFISNDRFFLNPMMAGVEAVTASAKQVPHSSVMAGMGGNGVEFGIQLAGTGNRWYTTKAPLILGTFLRPGYTVDDLLGYLGDSCVTEVFGLGGMSAIAGPSYVKLTGSTFETARERTERARAVSLGEHMFAPLPWDDWRGFPVGVDARRVVALGVLPISHGGSALKTGGQAGAGAAELPMECFKKALIGLAGELKKEEE